jgi:hypothetical protein
LNKYIFNSSKKKIGAHMPLFSYTGDFDFLRLKPKKIYKNLGVLKNGVNPPCFIDHENTAGKKGI